MYYETSYMFYIPEHLAREYKTHNEFHNSSYGMKIHLRFFLSLELKQIEQINTWNRLFRKLETDNAETLLCYCHALKTSSHGAV